MGRIHRAGRSKFPRAIKSIYPCGCSAILAESRDSMQITGGDRICRHGKRWRATWVRVKN